MVIPYGQSTVSDAAIYIPGQTVVLTKVTVVNRWVPQGAWDLLVLAERSVSTKFRTRLWAQGSAYGMTQFVSGDSTYREKTDGLSQGRAPENLSQR